MAQTEHNIDYIEFPTTDMAASKTFYSKAFGWTFEDWGPEYASIKGAGVEGGLRLEQKSPPRGGALVILYSSDIEASEKIVVDAGGEVTERHEFPGGRRFHFTDPSGNELGIWTKA